jgi:hypothetical protein
MNPTVMLGATLVVGGVLYFLLGKPKYINVLPLIPPPNQQYPIPAETSRYSEPPASEVSTLPPISSACSVSSVDEYNNLAVLMGLPLFKGSLPTNSPDDPETQMFNMILTSLKTNAGCYGVESQKETITTSLPIYSSADFSIIN